MAVLPPLLPHLRRLVDPSAADLGSDAELVGRFVRGGDQEAFAALVARHGPMVLRLCHRVLGDAHAAEDVSQATFLVLARKARHLRHPERLAAWLHGVAYRLALKARAADARRRYVETLSRQVAPPPASADPLEEVSGRELLAILDAELHRLPERYRLPLVLCCLEGRSQPEAARLLGWTPSSVKGRLDRARAKLRQGLLRHGLTLPAALLALEVEGDPAMARLPAELTAAVMRAAMGGASAGVTALAESGIAGMVGMKMKCALLLVLMLGAVTVGMSRLASGGRQPPDTSHQGADARRSQTAERSPRTDHYGDPLPPAAIARLGSLRLYHGEQVSRVTLSPDGKLVVSTAKDFNRLWDAVTGRELPLRKELRRAFVFAGRQKLLAVRREDTCFRLWDVADGKEIGKPLETGRNFSESWEPSPDGKTFALARWEKDLIPVLRFGDLATGKLSEPILLKKKGHVSRFAFSANGRTLVTLHNDATIHVWDVARRAEKLASQPRPADFSGWYIALSPDGTMLATAPLPGKRIRLWDTRTLKELPPLSNQPDMMVQPMTFAPDGKTLTVTYPSRLVYLWDLTTRKEKRRIVAKGSQIFHTAFSADGKTMAAADSCSVTLWDMTTGKCRHNFRFGHTYCVDSIHFSPDGNRLVSGAGYTDKIARVWNPLTGAEMAQLRGHAAGIEVVAYAPDGKLIASGSQDGTIRLWDAATYRQVRRLDAKAGMVYAMAFSPDGKTIAGGDWRSGIHLWDVATGRELRSFKNPGGVVLRLAFSPDGKIIATRGIDEPAVRLWDVAKGEPIRELMGRAAGYPSLAFSPDGQMLAAGSDDGVVRLWNFHSGKERPALAVPLREGEVKRVFSVAFSPDGRSLAVGYGEGDPTVRLWELASGRERACYEGHRGGVSCLAFSPDGTLLASGAPDRTILVWDVTGQRTARPKGRLSVAELNAIWSDLDADDARKADRGIRALVAAGDQAVAFLKEHIYPAAAIDGRRIDRLIADLDSDAFAARQKATKELRTLGDAAESALRKALAAKPSLEQRRRIKELLQEIDSPEPKRLRVLRAIEVLEHLHTSDARKVLQTLANGPSAARLTREAKAAVARMQSAR